jgi:hypothetical protein
MPGREQTAAVLRCTHARAHLDEHRGLCEVERGLAAIEGDLDVLELLEVLLQVLGDVDAPILREVPAMEKTFDKREGIGGK